MKKVVALILALVLALGAMTVASADKLADIQAAGKIVVGSNIGFAPYEFWYKNPETGKEELAGFDMCLIKAVADRIGVELEVSDQAFGGLLTALSVGELDVVIGAVSKKPERLEVVDFSDDYFTGTQIMVVRAEDYDTLKTVEDMAGKKIGAQLGALQQNILEEQFVATVGAEEELLEKVPVLVMELMNGELDGILLVDTVAKQYIAAYDNAIVISEVPVDYNSAYGCGIAVQKGDNESLLAVINEVIAEVLGDGTFDAWVDAEAAKAVSTLDLSAN